MKSTKYLIIILLTVSILTSAQFAERDSCKNLILYGNLSDIEMGKTYCEIAETFSGFAMDSVLFYAQKGIPFAKKTNDYKTFIALNGLCDLAFSFKSEFDSALYYIEIINKIAQQINNSKFEYDNYFHYGYVYARQGMYVTALDYYFKHLEFIEKNGVDRPDLMVRTYGNIGEINRRLHNYDEAIFWFEKGIRFAENNNQNVNNFQIDMTNFRLKACYLQLGAVYYEIGQPERALEYILQVELTARVVEDGYGCTTLALIYLQKHDFKKALEYANLALKPAEYFNDRQLLVNVWTTLAKIYMATGNYAQAETEAKRAWQADTTNIDENRAVTLLLAQTNLHLGHVKTADLFLQKNAELNRLYSEHSLHTTISDMEIHYKTEQQNRQIATLENENILFKRLWYALLAIVVLAAAAFVIFWFFQQTKIRLKEKEQKLLASEAVSNGENEERKRIARDLHDGLGGLLSAVQLNLDNADHLDNARSLLTMAIEELRRISHNLMPTSLVYGVKIALEEFCNSLPNVKFHYYGNGERLSEKTDLLLYRCAYELVNNALKHSLSTEINVQLMQNNETVTLTIQDEGIGFDVNSVKSGAGLNNIKARIADKGRMEIFSDKNGTEINIEIKI